MARKIKKTASTPPLFLFVELLLPWLVMGVAAVVLSEAGVNLEIVFVVSIAGAVAATFLMREFERYRRRRAARGNG